MNYFNESVRQSLSLTRTLKTSALKLYTVANLRYQFIILNYHVYAIDDICGGSGEIISAIQLFPKVMNERISFCIINSVHKTKLSN